MRTEGGGRGYSGSWVHVVCREINRRLIFGVSGNTIDFLSRNLGNVTPLRCNIRYEARHRPRVIMSLSQYCKRPSNILHHLFNTPIAFVTTKSRRLGEDVTTARGNDQNNSICRYTTRDTNYLSRGAGVLSTRAMDMWDISSQGSPPATKRSYGSSAKEISSSIVADVLG